jgi:hypothetical protein
MIEVAVMVAMHGLDAEEHFLYLAPYSDRRDVPKMINRDQVLWLRYEKLPSLVEQESTMVERLTIVELSDGTRIEGMVPIDRPREQSRISDVLNDAREAFLRIDDEGETYFVNKRFIRVVIPR